MALRNGTKRIGADGRLYDAHRRMPTPAPAIAAIEREERLPKNGSVKFDFNKFNKAISIVIRMLDDLHRAYPNRRLLGTCLADADSHINRLLADVGEWRKTKR